MKKIIIFSLFALFTCNIYSQDILIQNNGSEIKSKILEITNETIKYKKFETLDGPIRNINISDVFMVIYENGKREKFSTKTIKINNNYKTEEYSVKWRTRMKKIKSNNYYFLENEEKINIEYVYDNMSIDDYQDEEKWIKYNIIKNNNIKDGKGDNWAKNWTSKRKTSFQPTFEKYFNKTLRKKCKIIENIKDAKYTIIINTILINTGSYSGVVCNSANLHIEFIFIETAAPNHILAKLVLKQESYSDIGAIACTRQSNIWKRINIAYGSMGGLIGKFLYNNVYK